MGGSRGTRRRLASSVALVLFSLAVRATVERNPANFFPAYRQFSKAYVGLVANALSFVPFAVWDIFVLLFVAWVLIMLVRRLMGHGSIFWLLSVVCLVVSVNYFLFSNCWALNHYAPALSSELGLEVREYTPDELEEATRQYLGRAAELAPSVPRDEQGALVRQDFYELAGIAANAYRPLASDYAIFEGPRLPVKALLVWGEPLLYSGHTGMFWAPTGESGVPINCSVADTPFIMCHEAAHRLAIASEQEANFAAFLACQASEDPRFVYAGYYNAFAYSFNALYKVDPERSMAMLESMAGSELGPGVALVWNDYVANSEYYKAYDGPFEQVGSTVNDSYLKNYGETAGVQSYGLVVDYLIAWLQSGHVPAAA